jgi:hypothetical protein
MSVTTATRISPFKVPVAPRAELEALRKRVAETRWPERELVADLLGPAEPGYIVVLNVCALTR